MLIVKLPSSDASLPETTDKTENATPPPIRIPYSCHDGLQTRFLTLANSDADWPSESIRSQPVFIVFQYNTHGKGLGFCETLIDSRATKRKPGEERLIFTPEVLKSKGHGLENIHWSYDEAVRWFPWLCREKRFVEGLDRRFFICVDGEDVVERGVLLVRRDWDGDVWGRKREELLGLPRDAVRDVRAPVEEALVVLEKGRRGEIDGLSERLKEFFS
ncbi:amino acid permease protein [Rutstroemia sp. NJR-2017a BVV2]|nr:amino acid permease protein [Rutstroemia sp. NJR-2017a BVV2]